MYKRAGSRILDSRVNPLQPILWILRQNEKDIINLYNLLTPFIQLVTKSNMLNFGYWTENTKHPVQAQEELCTLVGKFAELHSAKIVLDIGSGFSAPAIHWKKTYNNLDIVCVNTNAQQLSFAAKTIMSSTIVNFNRDYDIKLSTSLVGDINSNISATGDDSEGSTSLVNATATMLPFASHCVDRIIALESAQHFKPLRNFIKESKRILKNDGLFVIAIPVTNAKATTGVIRNITKSTMHNTHTTIQSLIHFRKLGLLSLTWASEHYELAVVRSMLTNEGFKIEDIQHIGPQVYGPIAEYYIHNRRVLKDIIMKQKYSQSITKNILYSLIENVIYKSALKMMDLSKKRVIDYVLIKAK